ncbi:hypothetical protein, partial [Staphylococcus aureus]
ALLSSPLFSFPPLFLFSLSPLFLSSFLPYLYSLTSSSLLPLFSFYFLSSVSPPIDPDLLFDSLF